MFEGKMAVDFVVNFDFIDNMTMRFMLVLSARGSDNSNIRG